MPDPQEYHTGTWEQNQKRLALIADVIGRGPLRTRVKAVQDILELDGHDALDAWARDQSRLEVTW